MKRDDKILLNDILESIKLIEDFTTGFGYDIFIADEKTKSAVVRQFEIIGEAIKILPDEIKEKYSEVEWHKAAGLRNALIHGYFEVDYDLIWKTIKIDLPEFKKQISKVLKDLP